jgi:hypothetical protein
MSRRSGAPLPLAKRVVAMFWMQGCGTLGSGSISRARAPSDSRVRHLPCRIDTSKSMFSRTDGEKVSSLFPLR